MTLEEEFRQFVRASYGAALDPDSAQFRDLRSAFFGGAMIALGLDRDQLIADVLAFLASLRTQRPVH